MPGGEHLHGQVCQEVDIYMDRSVRRGTFTWTCLSGGGHLHGQVCQEVNIYMDRSVRR